MGGYIGQIQQLVNEISPWFLRRKYMGTFLQSCAIVADTAIASLDLGLRLGQPLRCSADALPGLSYDRSIRLYPTESEMSKRRRLANWLTLHRQRATHIGEMRHVQPYFLPEAPMLRIVHQDGLGNSATWHTLAGDGTYSKHKAVPSNWDYDGRTAQWSRWWAIVYVPASFVSMRKYDDGCRWDDGTVYDGVLAAVSADIVAMFLEWKAAHSRLQAVILATDPASFDPTASPVTLPDGSTTLPLAGNWIRSQAATGEKTRLATAQWVYERGQG
jgi:hypothetical protein